MPKDELDPDDPMELIPVSVEGSLDEMAEGLIDELLLAGYDQEIIWELFSNPFYRSTHEILRVKGEEYVRAAIQRQFSSWAQFTDSNEMTAGQEIESP